MFRTDGSLVSPEDPTLQERGNPVGGPVAGVHEADSSPAKNYHPMLVAESLQFSIAIRPRGTRRGYWSQGHTHFVIELAEKCVIFWAVVKQYCLGVAGRLIIQD